VRRPDMLSTHHERPAGVPEFFQCRENLVSPSNSQSRDVLNEEKRWSAFGDESVPLPPETAAGAFEPNALSSDRDVLAGEPPGPNWPFPVCPGKPKGKASDSGKEVALFVGEVGWLDIPDISLIYLGLGEVLAEDLATEGVDFV
jgi:hypothetical protein